MANLKSHSNYNKPLTDEVMIAYRKGLLSPKEMHEVEKRLLEDEMEADALEGFSLLDENKIANSVEDLKNRINKKTEENRRPQFIWYSVAAGLAVLITTTWVILSGQNSNTEKIARADEIKIQATENNRENLTSNEAVSSPPLENNISSTNSKGLRNSDFIARNESNPSLGHLSKPVSPLASEEAIEMSQSIAANADISSPVLDTISSISPTMAQARAAEREETIELKSSQAPPLAGIAPQQKENKVMGQVLADDGKALQGVDVMIKGTTLATITDRHGYFSIPSAPGATLTFKYQGHAEEEVVVKDKNNPVVNVTLEKESPTQSAIALRSPDEKSEEVSNQDQRRKMSAYKGESEGENTSSSKMRKPVPAVNKKQSQVTSPVPVTGLVEYKKYLKEGIKDFNKIEKNLPEMLVIEFIVNKEASFSNIKIQPTVSKPLTDEINRLINEGPKWVPANKGDEAINYAVSIDIDLK